ncbi:MAG: DUF4172 domain-containing protein [Candidatus Acidiferrales bacterium]
MYIHELEDWSRFRWSAERIAEPLASIRHWQGRLIGHMEALGFHVRQEVFRAQSTCLPHSMASSS